MSQQKEPEFKIDGVMKLLKHENGPCRYETLYDIERSIEDLFTEIEGLTHITHMWARPGSLQQVLSTRNEDGSLTLHFYDFRKSPEPVGWMARIANGSLFWEHDLKGFEDRHVRMLLWMITVLHPKLPWYNPDAVQVPDTESFERFKQSLQKNGADKHYMG